MNLHYTLDEMRMLKDRYFTDFKQVSYVVYLTSRCTGIRWIVLANREMGDNISVFYKLRTELMYNRFSDFKGYDTMEEAIRDMKEYDVSSGFWTDDFIEDKERPNNLISNGIINTVLNLVYTVIRSSNV